MLTLMIYIGCLLVYNVDHEHQTGIWNIKKSIQPKSVHHKSYEFYILYLEFIMHRNKELKSIRNNTYFA